MRVLLSDDVDPLGRRTTQFHGVSAYVSLVPCRMTLDRFPDGGCKNADYWRLPGSLVVGLLVTTTMNQTPPGKDNRSSSNLR